MNDVIARRAGRIAFGVVLLVGVTVLVHHVLEYKDRDERPFHAWHIVLATWLGAFGISCAVSAFVALLPRPYEPDTLRRAALAVPAVGIALALPITLHMPFALWDGGARSFDDWCLMSLLFVGHVHVVFAGLVFARAHALTGDAIRRVPSISMIHTTCVLLALLPVFIPAVFVAFTGIPLVFLLGHMRTIAARDREASSGIPFAILRAA